MVDKLEEDDLKLTPKDEVADARVKELRAELERLGRFGIVSWTDDDLIDALENAGATPTVQNVAAVREYVQDIADEMTATGWRVIEEAIRLFADRCQQCLHRGLVADAAE